MTIDLSSTIPVDAVRAGIGEGPAWDSERGRLLWVDIPPGIVYATEQTESGSWETVKLATLPRPVGAVVPRASGGYVAASGNQFCALSETGEVESIAEIPVSADELRLNDGKCDPAGRFFAGTQTSDGTPTGQAALYCLDLDGSVRTILPTVGLSNGLGWSADGTRMYYIDTPTLGIDVFDVDPADGSVYNRRRLITIEFGGGRPDGLCVDNEGYLWVAVFYSGTVRRYAPDGTPAGVVRISAPLATSCAFGGDDGETLFITSSSFRMPEQRLLDAGMSLELGEQAAAAPSAGGLFAVKPGVGGPAAVAYAG